MTTQFPSDGPESRLAGGDAAARARLAHAAEVMADLAGATEESLRTLPPELPVEAVVACGNCRLYGDVAAQAAFPGWLATAAARRLVALLDKAAADAERLPKLWDECTGDEAEALLAGLVHVRMDSWAAGLQLSETLEHATDASTRPALEAAIDAFDVALERFDIALDGRQDYLAGLAGTRLLANLRAMLAPRFRDPLPWWLDGRLEAEAAAIDARTDEMLTEILHERPVIRTLPIARLRALTSQTYAAAAAAPAAPGRGSRLRWRSPDRRIIAELIPPLEKKPMPDRIVLDFTTAAGAPALELAGRNCLLAGARATIEQQLIDGVARAIASFSGASVLGTAAADDQPVALVVDTFPGDWVVVSPR